MAGRYRFIFFSQMGKQTFYPDNRTEAQEFQKLLLRSQPYNPPIMKSSMSQGLDLIRPETEDSTPKHVHGHAGVRPGTGPRTRVQRGVCERAPPSVRAHGPLREERAAAEFLRRGESSPASGNWKDCSRRNSVEGSAPSRRASPIPTA